MKMEKINNVVREIGKVLDKNDLLYFIMFDEDEIKITYGEKCND